MPTDPDAALIESMARAMATARFGDPDATEVTSGGSTVQLGKPAWKSYVEAARAHLAASRVLTPPPPP